MTVNPYRDEPNPDHSNDYSIPRDSDKTTNFLDDLYDTVRRADGFQRETILQAAATVDNDLRDAFETDLYLGTRSIEELEAELEAKHPGAFERYLESISERLDQNMRFHAIARRIGRGAGRIY